MAMKFKIGDAVRQVVPVVQGTVTGKQIIGDDVHYNVRWTDAAGNVHERAFAEDEIEAADQS